MSTKVNWAEAIKPLLKEYKGKNIRWSIKIFISY